jgi:protein gp37
MRSSTSRQQRTQRGVQNAKGLAARVPAVVRFVSFEPLIGSVAAADLTRIGWAIVGGEGGPRARDMRPEWVEEVEAMCRSSGTAFFFKQWGGKNKRRTGRMLRGHTYDEMPTSHPTA